MKNLSDDPTKRLVVIPFSGLYNSVHDAEIDWALEQMFQDENGNENEALSMRAWEAMDWHKVHLAYAEAYAENFGAEFELPSLKFDELNSPKFYNFETDRIFVYLSLDDLRKVFERVPRADLEAMAREMFTSRSGFISSYSNDIEDWGDMEDWDHNQLYCLLNAMVGDDFDSWKQADMMESDRGNGHFDNWLWDAMDPVIRKRLDHVYSYLRQREERKWVHPHAA